MDKDSVDIVSVRVYWLFVSNVLLLILMNTIYDNNIFITQPNIILTQYH